MRIEFKEKRLITIVIFILIIVVYSIFLIDWLGNSVFNSKIWKDWTSYLVLHIANATNSFNLFFVDFYVAPV